jgi:hypothetical protein
VRFFVTADANAETRVGEATNFSAIAEFWFGDKDYGAGLDGVGVIVTCRRPDLKLKQRIRLETQKNAPSFIASSRISSGGIRKPVEKWLSMDLMLDYNEFVKAVSVQQYSYQISAKLYHTDEERERIIRERIVEEVPAMVRKYVTRKRNPLKDFDVDAFERDLRTCLLEGGLEEVTPEYEAEVRKMDQAWQRHKEMTGRDILLPGEELPEP